MKTALKVFLVCFIILAALQTVKAVEFNGRDYTLITSEWYEVYQGENYPVVGTEIFVWFSSSATQQQINSLNSSLSGDVIKVTPLGGYLIESSASSPPDPLDFCDDYLDAGIVDSALNNTQGYFCDPDDDYFDDQRHLETPQNDNFDNDINVNIGDAWNDGAGVCGDEDILVGILDSGLLYWHSDLAGNVWENLGEDFDEDGNTIVWDAGLGHWIYDPGDDNNNDDDGNGFVDDLIGWNTTNVGDTYEVDDLILWANECSHGTAVSSIIAAVTNNDHQFSGIAGGWGVALPGCSVVFAKMGPVFDHDNVIEGLDYLINGAEVDIIVTAFRCPPHPEVDLLLWEAEDDGIIVTAASGNQNEDEVNYPAIHETTIAVGASADDDRSGFSNYGDELHIVAPSGETEADGLGDECIIYTASSIQENVNGTEVEVDPDFDLEDCEFGGTSGSSAEVGGAVALLLTQEPDLTREEVYEILLITTSKDDEGIAGYIPGSQYGSWHEEMGYGELNVGNALAWGQRFEVALPAGWSMISSYMMPYFNAGNALNDDEGIYLMFDELADDLDVLQDGAGNEWDPDQAQFEIPSWDFSQSYKIKLTAAATWVTLGQPVEFGGDDWDIAVDAGWNYVAYYPTWELEAEDAFVSLWNGDDIEILIQAKDADGCFYIPSIPFNNMPDLEPGQGYMVNMDEAGTLTYPDEEGDLPASEGARREVIKPSHFQFASRTGDFHSLVVTDVKIKGLNCESGDEIGVFTEDGLCVGASVYEKDCMTGVAIWKDDPTTSEVDGYRETDDFQVRYWDKDNSLEICGDDRNALCIFTNIDAAIDPPSYTVYDLTIDNPVEILPTTFTVDQNYPNPFNSETIITYGLPDAGVLNVKIFDVQGRLVRKLFDGHQGAGWHRALWDGRNSAGHSVTSGMYLYDVNYESNTSNSFRQTGEMLLIR